MSSLLPEHLVEVSVPSAEPEAIPGTPSLTVAPAPRTGRRGGRLARGRVRSLVTADVIAVIVAALVTYVVAQAAAPPAIVAPDNFSFVLLPAFVAIWIAVFATYRLYESQTHAIAPSSIDEVGRLFNALLAGSLLLLVAGQVLKRITDWAVYSPAEALFFLCAAIVLVPSLRGVVRTWILPAMIRPRRALIVGSGPVGRLVGRKIEAHPEYGLDLVGFVDDADRTALGRTEDLTGIVDELDIDWVLLASEGGSYETTLDRVRAVRRPDVHLSIVPNYFELFASNAAIEDLEGMPIVSLPPMSLSRSARALKRSFDVVASAAGLLVLAPVLAMIAIAIKLDSRGPVFFRQPRHGRGGGTFQIVKFRTMVADAEQQRFDLADRNEMEGGGPLFKIREDPRVTRVGRVLRSWSLDELPQLWNVLRGDMSLVGPRPFVVHESEQITGWAGRRLETTPGITGLWQVLGRNDIPFDEMVKLDYVYVTSWSLWWDIKILCQTIPVVLARRGAY
jgi:exopolysaccharide biosynthesis polyprenyl glycosylphosphotransferase